MSDWRWGDPMARFNGFTKWFGDNCAVDDLTFQVGSGRVCGLLGRNGAGKTTALRGLLSLLKPTSGTATVFGEEYGRIGNPARKVGVSMDGIGFHPAMSARRNLEIYAAAAGLGATHISDVLDGLDLTAAARRPVGKFSMGMKQRLSIGAAIIGDPELLVLDEPTNGLDPHGIRWLRSFLRQLAAEGRTILLSSHMLAELEQAIDDVVILQQHVLFAGPLDELTDEGRTRLETRFFELVRDDGVLL